MCKRIPLFLVLKLQVHFSGGWTMTDTTERRLELLNMEGLGFFRAEIVKELSVKANVTERTVYKDSEN